MTEQFAKIQKEVKFREVIVFAMKAKINAV